MTGITPGVNGRHLLAETQLLPSSQFLSSFTFAMKTILIISDQTREAVHAGRFALELARATRADLLLAYTVPATPLRKALLVTAGSPDDPDELLANSSKNIFIGGRYQPKISNLDISGYPLDDLVALINRKDIWLIIEGMSEHATSGATPKFNRQSLLNRVRCPLLLVPKHAPLRLPERIAYLADLRYCRREVLRFLNELAPALTARLTIANLAAKGLADVVDSYAAELFRKDVMPHTTQVEVSLNNIRERDLHKAADVLIHGMQQDWLVLVNHRYHFEELIGRRLGDTLPSELTVPLLIFPL